MNSLGGNDFPALTNRSSQIVNEEDFFCITVPIEKSDVAPDQNGNVARSFKNKHIPTHYAAEDLHSKSKIPRNVNLKLSSVTPKKVAHNTDKKPTTLKKAIIQAREDNIDAKSGFPLAEDEFDVSIIQFIRTIKQKQDVLWKENENKARSRRRIVCGLHETLKHLKLGDLRCVIVAKNIDTEVVSGSASDLFNSMRSICLSDNIPLVYGATKKSLSKAVNKFPYTNVIGVLRFDGYEENFANIITRWNSHYSHVSYHKDQSSLFP